MLCGSHFVMLCFRSNAKLPEFNVNILHKGSDTFSDTAVIMIAHLLSFRCTCAEKGSSGVDQIVTLQIFLAVNKEIFLFRTDAGRNLGGRLISEKTDDTKRLLVNCLSGTKEGCLFIQCFSLVGTECSGNAKDHARGIFSDKSRGSNIPCRISSCLECCTKSARREGRSVGFSLDQFLSGKLHKHLSVRIGMGDKGIMLLRRKSG